jgi:hypothetical protein
VDGGCVGLHVIVAGQVKRLAHAENVAVGKKRTNVGLIAGRFGHRASQASDYEYISLTPVECKTSGTLMSKIEDFSVPEIRKSGQTGKRDRASVEFVASIWAR